VQEPPVPEQLRRIEELANEKVTEDAPVLVFVADFDEAKARYGFAMCDSFMPKPGPVTLAYLDGWNINVVEEGPEALLASTRGIGRIEVLPLEGGASSAGGEAAGSKFAKGKLDLRFRIHDSAAGAPRSAAAPASISLPDPAAVALLNPKVEKKKKGGESSGAVGAGAVPPAPAPAAPPRKGAQAAQAAARADGGVAPAAAAAAAAASAPAAAAAASAPAAAAAEPPDCTPTAIDGAVEHHHGGAGQTVTPWEVDADEGGIDYEKLIRVGAPRP
jgi:hypothetical protein